MGLYDVRKREADTTKKGFRLAFIDKTIDVEIKIPLRCMTDFFLLFKSGVLSV